MAELPYIKDRTDEFLAIADKCGDELKKAITVLVFHHLAAHARDGRSYRGLIYERLGFGPDGYADLFDGLAISNCFHEACRLDDIRKVVAREQFATLKEPLDLCDVADCYESAVASGGGRRTCSEHDHLKAPTHP